MNVLSNPAIRAQDQDLPLCPPGFGLNSRLHPAAPPMLSLQGAQRSAKPQRELSAEEQQELRRKINSRERKRMQDLNIAMDALREVMVPYAASSPSSGSHQHSAAHHHHHHHHHQPGAPPGRRLSKISTLVLARNYILLLGSSLQEMRRLLGEVSIGMGVNAAGPVPRLLLAGGWPLISGPGQLLLTQESLLSSAASSSSSSSSSSSTSSASSSSSAVGKCPLLSPGPIDASLAPVQWGSAAPPGGPLCPCGVCRLPRFGHGAPAPRFPK
ncbi:unnamed protein product [Ophioblennius macclurei]